MGLSSVEFRVGAVPSEQLLWGWQLRPVEDLTACVLCLNQPRSRCSLMKLRKKT